MKGLAAAADDAEFREEWAAVKLAAKVKAATFLEQRCGVKVDPTALFDVQVCVGPSHS